jgi:predicted hydrocarbon binding protein
VPLGPQVSPRWDPVQGQNPGLEAALEGGPDKLTSPGECAIIIGTGELNMVSDETGSDAAGHYFLPNKMGRVLLLSLEDVMGRSALHAVLSHARLRHLIDNYPPANLDLGWRFEETSAVLQALEDVHGGRAGQSIAIRAGRASFYRIRDELGSVLGPANRRSRFAPLVPRLRAGLGAVAELYNITGDQVVHVEESTGQLLFQVDRCPVCWGRDARAPICRTEAGLLQEAVHWVSGGRNIAVEEVQCIAAGSLSCCYAVEKRPLD